MFQKALSLPLLKVKHRAPLLLRLMCFVCAVCFIPMEVLAAQRTFSPAFKTVGIWDKAKAVRVDVNVWYPTYSQPSTASYGPWRLNVVRYGRSVSGRFPVVILSHDSPATRFSYHDTAAMLVRSGFVVIAPEHSHDSMENMSFLFHWKQLEQRIADIHNVLNVVLSHKDIKGMVDAERVAILGFGTGATTALLMGGARLDASGWDDYCLMVPQSTAYCNAWAVNHVQKMRQELPPMTRSFQDKRIKAVVAVSPKYDMFFTQKALRSMHIPLLLLETEGELGKRAWHAQKIQVFFPKQTSYAVIDGVDELDLMAPCPQEWRKDLPDLCGTAGEDARNSAHEAFQGQVLHFLLERLGKIS